MKPVILSVSNWRIIRAMLQEEYPKTVFMIRDKMKRVLGFTVREHQEWVKDSKAYTEELTPLSLMIDFDRDGWYKGKRHEHTIRLDFYSENKRTMFLLKFSDVISREHNGTR